MKMQKKTKAIYNEMDGIYIPSISHILQEPVTWNSVIGLHEICQNYANKPDFKEVGQEALLSPHGKTKADNFNSGLSTNKNDDFSIICLLVDLFVIDKKKMPHNNIIKC